MDLERFRPMLAASLPSAHKQVPTAEQVLRDLQGLDWSRGLYASPKMDGIRAIKHPTEGLVSRTLKPIRNRWIQQCLSHQLFDYLDGELVCGEWDELIDYNSNQSAIMSGDGEFKFTWCVFDYLLEPWAAFRRRSNEALGSVIEASHLSTDNFVIRWLEQKHLMSVDELLEYEAETIARGFEGLIVRDPGCRYKNGRATWLQQGMFKLKRFIDAEAIIEGFEELYRNNNPATVDKLGLQVRSGHNAGHNGAGTLGKLIVRGLNGSFADTEFSIGSGLDELLRDLIWNNRSHYVGRVVKYKYQHVGAKDKPRTPIYLGFRDAEDIT